MKRKKWWWAVLIAAWVMSQPVLAAAGELFLDVDFVGNWFFDTYDVDLFLDGEVLARLPHGTDFSQLLDQVEEGEHLLSFRSAEDPRVRGSYELYISGDTTFQCSISCSEERISLSGIKQTEGTELAHIPVRDCSEEILSTAVSQLKQAGFVNITERSEQGSIWDRDAWIVVSQDPRPGSVHQKNKEIILTCIRIEDYLEDHFQNATVATAPKVAQSISYEITFVNAATGAEMDSRVLGMDEKEKALWSVSGLSPNKNGKRKVTCTATCQGNRTMPDCYGKVLSECIRSLQGKDFTKISYKSDSSKSIWDTSNWYVVGQNRRAGEIVPADSDILLTARHKDDIEEGFFSATPTPVPPTPTKAAATPTSTPAASPQTKAVPAPTKAPSDGAEPASSLEGDEDEKAEEEKDAGLGTREAILERYGRPAEGNVRTKLR